MPDRMKNHKIISFLRQEFLRSAQRSALPAAIREARTFEYILENIPLYYHDGEWIAGDFGWRKADEESLRHYFISPDPSAAEAAPTTRSPEEELLQEFHCFGAYSPGHTCIDYQKLITVGIAGILKEISGRQIEAGSKEEGTYLEAMKIAMEALLKYVGRVVELLEQCLVDTQSEYRAKLLKELIRICRKVPCQPAADFHEALQSIWFVHSLIGISEYCDASISLGRFEQYLYPFYLRSIESGDSAAGLENILCEFFVKLNRYGDAACTVNLGGVDKEGKDLCNPLTEMVVKVFAAHQFASPILALRVHPRIPQNIFDQLTDPALLIKGQPTFYGESSCRNALVKRGVPLNEVDNWAANSCMGLVIPGAEISDMWGGVVNFLLPLELAVNQGKPFIKTLPIHWPVPFSGPIENFECLRRLFLEYLKALTNYCIRNNQIQAEKTRQEYPNPFLSSFLNKCIERGLDRLGGGVEYYTVIVEAFGLINVSDALLAIHRLVFKEKKYSLADLVCAARENFIGHETLLREIKRIPKYGNGHVEADQFAAELADDFYGIVHSFSNARVVYAPSFHTLNVHIPAGKKFGASLDGRLAGEPVAKNIGTSPGRALSGSTSLMNSAATIDQSKYFGGQALDISLDASLVSSPDAKRKFQALIQTYFQLGGLQLQINGLTAETLRAAVEEPENYRDLIVRIAGYSEYFNRLGSDVKHEMVKRLSCGM